MQSLYTLCMILVLGVITHTSGTEMDLNAENLRAVFSDFAHELASTQSDAVNDDGGRRRSLLLFSDAFDPEPFLRNFDLEVALSDFLDGVLQTPIFDFLTGLPQSQDQWEDIIQTKYNDFCSEPQQENGKFLLQSCEGPEITIELVPGICEVIDRYPLASIEEPLYTVVCLCICREHNQFNCQAPRLEYRRTGPVCTNSFREQAQFVDKECKFVQQLGVEKEVVLGGGSKDTLLRFGRQNIEIIPDFDFFEFSEVVAGLFSDLTDFPDVPDLPFF